jgi:hypothetical protein
LAPQPGAALDVDSTVDAIQRHWIPAFAGMTAIIDSRRSRELKVTTTGDT